MLLTVIVYVMGAPTTLPSATFSRLSKGLANVVKSASDALNSGTDRSQAPRSHSQVTQTSPTETLAQKDLSPT